MPQMTIFQQYKVIPIAVYAYKDTTKMTISNKDLVATFLPNAMLQLNFDVE